MIRQRKRGRRGTRKTLTLQQARFVEEYLVDLNASAAYARAGYRSSGRTLQALGPRLSKLPHVAAAIAARQRAHLQRASISAERVLEELRRIAFSDLGAIFDEHDELTPVRRLPAEVRSALSSVKVLRVNLVSGDGKREWLHEVKAWDKLKALELLARHLHLVDDAPQTLIYADKLIAILEAGRQRNAEAARALKAAGA